MKKLILILNSNNVAPQLIRGLETGFNCDVETIDSCYHAKIFIEDNPIETIIVNPCPEVGKFIEPTINFVKGYLKDRNIPVIIYSRTGIEKIGVRTGLIYGTDYIGYIRKPSDKKQFFLGVRDIMQDYHSRLDKSENLNRTDKRNVI